MTQSNSEQENISGVWQGSYESNRLPEPVGIVMMFQQLTMQELIDSPRGKGAENVSGDTIVGIYKSEDGAIGTMSGSIEGENVVLIATQTTPTCPGRFAAEGVLSGESYRWKFLGYDCFGQHEGSGSATRS